MRFTAIFLLLFSFTIQAEQPPELVLQAGHRGAIHSLAISPDGKWLVSGGQDSTLKIWNLQTGHLLRTLYGHNGKVVDVAISPDARYVASAAEDGTARLWDVAGGQQVRDLSGHRNLISSIAFAAGGQQVLTGSTDVIRVWESATGRELRSIAIPQKDQQGRLTLSSDGSIYGIGGAVNQPKTGIFSGFTGTGDIFRPLKLVEISSNRELMSYKTDIQAPYATYVLSPDSRLFAVRSVKLKSPNVEESIRVFDVRSGREIANMKVPGPGNAQAISPLAFSFNGRFLAAQGEINNSMRTPVYVFDVASKQMVRQFTTTSVFIPSIGPDALTFVSSPFAFSPDNKILALGGSSSIQLWEPESGKELRSLQTHLKAGATTDSFVDPILRDSLQQQGMTPQDASMLQTSADMMDSMMDEEGAFAGVMEMVGDVPGLKGSVWQRLNEDRMQFSTNGKWLLIETPNYIRTWDVASGALHQDRFAVQPPIAFNSNGTLYAAMEADIQELTKGNHVASLVIRDLETRTEISRQKWSGETPRKLLFGANDAFLAVHAGSEVRILDLKTLNAQRSFSVGSDTAIVSMFDESGRYFAIGGKPAPAAVPSASAGSDTGGMIFDPKMMEQLSKMMTKKMSRKEAEKIQKDMEKAMRGQKVVVDDSDPIEDMLTPSNYSIRIFDLQSGKQLQALSTESVVHDLQTHGAASMPLMGGGSRDLHRMQFSKDGRYLAVEDLDQQYPSVKIYETASGRRVSVIPVSRKKAMPVTATNMLTTRQVRPSFAFHPDGTAIAVSAQEGGYAVNLWDVSTGKQIRSLPHLSRVDAITFHPNGKLLVTRLRDSSVNVWEHSSGRLIATLMEFPGLYFTTEWLVATPDGLFDGSPAAWSQIMWRFSGSIFDLAPVETFFNDFYYPGLLSEVFGPTRPQAPRDLLRLDRRQPSVRLASDAKGDVRNATVRLEVAEQSAGSGARDVRLFRNGTLIQVWRGDALQGQTSRTLEATVPLVAGENRFVAYGFNKDNVKSPDSALMIKGDEKLARKGNAYIVAVGVNQYQNSDFNLKYAVADAQAFSRHLQESQTALAKYEKVEVISLFDQDATKAKIVEALKSFAAGGSRAAQPEDLLIVYYAGHGTADQSRFYMVPHDLGYAGSRAQMDDAAFETIIKNGISDEELEQLLETVIAGQTLLVIDACNSGQALESQERRRGPMNSKGLAQLAYEKGMYILAAAQGYQAALEAAKLGHGYLTYALVEEGIKTKSADHLPADGKVLVREWLLYASNRVPEMQSQTMQEARLLKHDVAFVDGEEKIQEVRMRSVQQPRVYYRREMESNPLVILQQ